MTRVCPIKDIVCSTPNFCAGQTTGCKLDTPSDCGLHGKGPYIVPPADPIDDLCGELNYIGMFVDERGDGISPMCKRAADALQRLRAERDALAAIVRAADAMRVDVGQTWEARQFDAARAKWEDNTTAAKSAKEK